jgi:hypothetical protein
MRAIIVAVSLLMVPSLPVAAQTIDAPACPGNAPCPQQPASNNATRPAAPVGHRQPTMNNLTPQVRHEETTGSAPADPLGPLPRICRNC